jgi:CheY-like chemotaxis protein
MTRTQTPLPTADGAVAPDWRPRSELALAEQQLRAVELFHRTRQVREQAAGDAARSRELRMDAARSIEVLRRQHDALVSRADEHLRASGRLLRSTAERRVVLAHRNDWLVRTVTQALEDRGVRIVAHTDNGADAVGLVVAEQPDLVLVEDTLAMVAGLEVVREIRRFAPDTVVAAQVAHGSRAEQLLDAGATAVFTRQMTPRSIAQAVLELVGH